MPTSKDAAEAIAAPLLEVADVRLRGMMGGWLVYADEVLVGQINEGELFVKRTPFSDDYAPDLERRPPYDGAEPAVVVPEARRDDLPWLRGLVVGSVEALRPGSARTSR